MPSASGSPPLKILHTADWHLGCSILGRKRYSEFDAVLDWLAGWIEAEGIHVVLIAGDVFDTTTPSNRAQEQYFRFLSRVSASDCRHLVVTAGNHDSPTFLDAPRHLLRTLSIHVVGQMPPDPHEEVLVLRDAAGQPEAVVCATPYLRDRDIRTVEPGETPDQKGEKVAKGVAGHYQQVVAIAEKKRQELNCGIPLIALGHLFAAGGKRRDEDGVRELYVGTLAHIPTDTFPPVIDYLALGHLHMAQTVGGRSAFRYPGSLVPMGFADAGQEKNVLEVTFHGTIPTVREIPVPCFQPLVNLHGSLADVEEELKKLVQQESRAWVCVTCETSETPAHIREHLETAVACSSVRILRIRNLSFMSRFLDRLPTAETLADLQPLDVFQRCLEAHDIPENERDGLRRDFQEILSAMSEKDLKAE